MNYHLNSFALWFRGDAPSRAGILQILLPIFLLAATASDAQNSCVYGGEIDYEENGDHLNFAFTEMPWFDCSDAVTIDSVKVKWFQLCNQWSDKHYVIAETGLNDTLTIPAEGWRATWAQTTWYSKDFASTGAISVSSQAVFYAAPDAPFLTEDITPNPNNGNFEIEQKTNAIKQYTMIIGPYGLVYSKWHYGTCTTPIHLLSLNPAGIYQVITRWHFEDECAEKVVTRQGFVLVR